MNAKAIIIVAAVGAALVLGACRREEHHEPMKLGAATPSPVHSTR